MRSLTLIEPVLPTLLCESDADRRLHARFAQVAREVSEDIWNGSVLEAIDKFIEFWNGSGPQDPLPASARLRMIERADKLAFDFTAAFAEENVATAAASLRVPTLLFSGGLSPYLTQRIVQRLGAIIDGAEIRHLPAAGHMLPLTHASSVNPAIARHIARADELAGVPLALEAALAEAVSRGGGVTSWRLARLRAFWYRLRTETGNEMPMTIRARDLSPKLAPLIAAGMFCLFSCPALAADEPEAAAPKGAAVTVLKAAKSCFANIVEVSGIIIPREENAGAARADGAEGRRGDGGCRATPSPPARCWRG